MGIHNFPQDIVSAIFYSNRNDLFRHTGVLYCDQLEVDTCY